MTWRLDQKDYRDWLGDLPAECVDLAIFDTPYESLERHRKKGTTTRLANSKASSNIWFPVIENSALDPMMGQLYRVMKQRTYTFAYTDPQTLPHIIIAGRRAGFWFWNVWIWVKTDKKGNPRPGMGYHGRRTWEGICVFEKRSLPCHLQDSDPRGDGRRLNYNMSDVIFAPPPSKQYPTAKSPEVARRLIAEASDESDLVIDFFTGGGSTGAAALSTGRRFAGCDIQDESIVAAGLRLRAIGGPPTLPWPKERGVMVKRPQPRHQQSTLF